MKRDLNLIRGILLDVEEAEPGRPPIQELVFENKGQFEIAEHVQLLLQAGFIEGQILHGGMGEAVGYVISRLTWSGHEFLANAKNNTIWKKVLAQAEEKGISASVVVINGLLEAAAKKYAGLS